MRASSRFLMLLFSADNKVMKRKILFLILSVLIVFTTTSIDAYAADPSPLKIDGTYELVSSYDITLDGETNPAYIVRVPTSATYIDVNLTESYTNITNYNWDPYYDPVAWNNDNPEYYRYSFSGQPTVYKNYYSNYFGNSGFSDYNNYTYYDIEFVDSNDCSVASVFVFQSDIPINGGGDDVDKTELTSLLATVSGENEKNWWQSGDRYNGNPSDTIADRDAGFWEEFTATDGPRDTAQKVVDATRIDETSLNSAVSSLSAAIAKLIPRTQVNATALYEAVDDYDVLGWQNGTAVPVTGCSSGSVTKDTTSLATWSAYQDALTDARALLDSLFDGDGAPTDENVADNQEEVDAAADALKEAAGNLDQRIGTEDVARSETALAEIKLLADQYDPDELIEDDYTPDSWNTFVSARTAALDVWQKSQSYTGMGKKQLAEQTDAMDSLRAACYGLTETKTSITVHFSAVDSYAVQKGVDSMAVNTCDLSMTPGSTVADALTQAGVTLSTKSLGRIAVYLNGLLYFPAGANINSNTYSIGYENLGLHEGDTLTAVVMAPPLVTNASGSTAPAPMADVLSDMLYQNVAAVQEVQAGTPFTVTVTANGAMPTTYSPDGSTPVAGASIYTGTACAEKENAEKAAVTIPTYVTTDANGQAQVTLYAEGWCALNAFSLDGNGGLCNGPAVLVYVKPTDDLDAVKERLKTELTAAYEDDQYPKTYFSESDWTDLQNAYDDGISGIAAAETSGEARKKQLANLQTIYRIQKAADQSNDKNLTQFLDLLNELPDDTQKLDASAATAVKNLIGAYENMTEYQRSQLTTIQGDKYQGILLVYQKGLPDAVEYALSVKTVFDGVPEKDQTGLSAMIQWLQGHTATDDKYGDVGQNKLAALNGFDTAATEAYVGTTFNPIEKSGAMRTVVACTDPDYAAYLPVRDAGGTLTASDSSWSISDADVTLNLVNGNHAELTGNMDYTVNGNAYAVRSVEISGVEESDVTHKAISFYDASDYKGKSNGYCNLDVPDSFLQFTMPFHDVTVTVTWGPVAGTQAEIAAAKKTAKTAIQAAYANFDLTKYDEAGQAALLQAKTTGFADVEAATSVDSVKTARQKALAAMAAVKKTSSGTGGGTTVELPDYGDVVGQVYITVENNTFPGGDFTGTILSGTYDLCAEDTIMTAVLKALKTSGYSWTGTGGTGYSINYLASIYKDANENGRYDDGEKKLGEFDGEPGSGWMGMLNDWFVNEGLDQFGVGKAGSHALENGDVIDIVYTQNLGADVGGTWNDSDTSLSALKISGGTLTPTFDSDTRTYNLLISGNQANVTVTPTAENKNYLVKTFLNTYNSDAALYKRTETIPVKSGDVIYVGCGEYSWPSMNNQSKDAISYSGTKYTINVYSNGKSGVQARIDALPDAGRITLSNYQSYQGTVTQLREAYDALSTSEKSGMDISKLTALESKIAFFSGIQNVRDKLSTLISNDSATDAQVKAAKSAIEAADAAYKALSAEQKKYIMVGDVTNYNELVERLSSLTTTSAGTISGSTTAPASAIIEQEAAVSGKSATVVIPEKSITSAISAVKDSGETAIVIVPTGTGSATSIMVSLPKSAVKSVVENSSAALEIETDSGHVTIPNDTLSQMVSAASGSDLVVTVSKKSASDVTDQAIDTKNARITEVTVTSGGDSITTFGGKMLTVSIPVDSAYSAGVSYQVIIISAGGKTETTSGKCVKTDGKLFVEATAKHLSTFIVTNQRSMNFTDVKSGDWCYDAVKYVYENGLFAGATDTTFSPDASMTRAMLVAVLYRMEGSPAVTGAGAFTDVTGGKYYTDAVAWASANKIVNGVTATAFAPDTPITREQMAAILYRYAQYKKYDTSKTADLSAFTDASAVGDFAADAMKWANGSAFITGTTATTLSPKGTATRAQVATILMRYHENAAK